MSTTTSEIRTRFPPSPTGYLHIGGARTALFSWAFARHFGGTFVLRIEDTDVERSTPEAVQAIFDGMKWLSLHHDEGPFFQMQRLDRYRMVIDQMLAAGTAYHCYMQPAELDALREDQRARGAKPRYDGRWRPENATGRPIPPSIKPVIRFKNPIEGAVRWDDLVKGPIAISNDELDDLIIARADGTPTYNFCVVVDDWDMRISHVIRGDDHVNNTPRQINILAALGAPIPVYGHVPMILGPDGEKLSKRHGAVAVTQYDDEGFLPEAVINYLARLGWSHGDDEIFSREQFVQWFDGSHLARSPAQFDVEKLKWLNSVYIKQSADTSLAAWVAPRLSARGVTSSIEPSRLVAACALFKDRCTTLNDLADGMALLFGPVPTLNDDARAAVSGTASVQAKALVSDFAAALPKQNWTREAISATIKQTITKHGVKMPQLAVPLRALVFGRTQTPAIDAMLALLTPDEVAVRLQRGLDALA